MVDFLTRVPKEEPGQAQLRRHYFLDQWVVIAPKRTHSLHHQQFRKGGELKSPPLEEDPVVLEIPGPRGEWAVRVIPNLFPAFSPGNKQAQGVQEIVLVSNPVNTPMSELELDQYERVFMAYSQRIEALSKVRDVNYISVFHNSGLEAGTSVRQTHSQIIALANVPPQLLQYAKAFSKLQLQYGISPIRKALVWEQNRLVRVIHSNKWLCVVAPYASQFPFEAWLVPWRSVPSIRDLKPRERFELARALKAITSALESEHISYNFHLQENLKGHDNHFMIKVCPRPNVWAGFELNTDITINPVAPEAAALWYRRFIKERHAI